jgi:SpoVK/Ycf46/Vps4 family AAA+-type ATPase
MVGTPEGVAVAGRELKALFRAFGEGDELAFRRAALQIIEEEEGKQHLALARDLRRLVSGSTDVTIAEAVQLPPPPTDREGQWSLAEVRMPSRHLEELVLPGHLEGQLRSVAREFAVWDKLDSFGLPRRQRILFYGPPGCGKTTAAEGLAAELGLPLLLVRLDAVVSSYLGETASNLRRVFDYASSGSWVVLLDEFDALGKSRDDSLEHGEIKRLLNAFLQMLDSFRGRSLLIAATNHEHLLDAALWRRFDEAVKFPRPTTHQIRRILRLRLPGDRRQGIDIEAVASRLKGLPHAAVEKAAWDALRFAVIDGRSRALAADMERAVEGVKGRPW